MTRWWLTIAVIAAAWPGLPAGGSSLQQQTFRTATDVVTVDVSVRADGRAVTGLKAADFVLLDNGVKQRIEAVEAAAVPIDVTVIVDVSGDRTWDRRVDVAGIAASLDAELKAIAKILRASDRLRMLGVDTYATQIVPLQAPGRLPAIKSLTAGGLSSLYDTLVSALVQQVEPGRRHIIVARTKGIDSMSAVDADVVRDVAARSDALLHIVGMSTAFVNDLERQRFQCLNMGLCEPTSRFWQPFTRVSFRGDGLGLTPAGDALAEAARVTGGAFHVTELLAEPTLVGTFRRLFDDFRSSYILQYTPQGVKREGWHEVTVTVPGYPGHVINAKRGYAVEPPAPEATRRAPPRGLATLQDLVAAYDKADYDAVQTGLTRASDTAQLIREFRAAGSPWPASPRREAVFALELAEAGLFSRRLADRDAAATLIAFFHQLIRHPLEPDAFERYWLWAELAIAQGMVRSTFAEPLVAHALSRFPDEPRFVLARAIITDQAWPFGMAVAGPSAYRPVRPSDAHITDVVTRYSDAIMLPETATEARVRLAWFLHRTGRDADALAHLDAIIDENGLDATMRYVHRLIRGHVLNGLDKPEAALDAYRQALALAPNAQSARVAIMNSLLRSGDRRGAEQIAEQIQTGGAQDVDPWWQYVQGDFRLYPVALGRLREMAR